MKLFECIDGAADVVTEAAETHIEPRHQVEMSQMWVGKNPKN